MIEEEKLVEHARRLGEHALRKLGEIATRHSRIGEVRGLGLLLGVELPRDHSRVQPASDEAERVMYAALQRGLNFKITMGNILSLTPALTVTQEEMDQALDILDAVIP